MAAAAMLDFQAMWISPFWRVDSVVFELCTKFGSDICYSHWDRRTYASDFHLMTTRELTSGFNFWSRGHLRMAVMHLPIKFCADIFIQSGVIDIFLKSKMAATAILDFQVMWIWPFRRVGSVVFVFCTKFGSNICYSHWDRRTYPSDIHLMTSRELTSGFDFWSRGHLCIAVMHLSIKFGAGTFVESGVIDIFPKFKMASAFLFSRTSNKIVKISNFWYKFSPNGYIPFRDFYKIWHGEGVPGPHPHAKFCRWAFKNLSLQLQIRQNWQFLV